MRAMAQGLSYLRMCGEEFKTLGVAAAILAPARLYSVLPASRSSAFAASAVCERDSLFAV